jgi:inorganic pyrophosphatase/exopolyphosphatase
MKIVTATDEYLDIDAYGSMVAYAELLNAQGIPAIAASSAPFNASITDEIRQWPAKIVRGYAPKADDESIIVDVSNPEYIEDTAAKIVEIIDHHPGYEQYWTERLGEKAHIEIIGAVATLIYERWLRAGKLPEMSQTSARLLICGILDNTLDFNADITTDRDREAYDRLKTLANFSFDPRKWYFKSVDQMISRDLVYSIVNDTKPNQPVLGGLTIGQLMMWDISGLIDRRRAEIEKTISKVDKKWLVNLINLSDKRSYFLASDNKVAAGISDLLGVKFKNGLAVASRMWLRKEILKVALGGAE